MAIHASFHLFYKNAVGRLQTDGILLVVSLPIGYELVSFGEEFPIHTCLLAHLSQVFSSSRVHVPLEDATVFYLFPVCSWLEHSPT